MSKSKIIVTLLGLSALIVVSAVVWTSGAKQREIESYPKVTIPVLNTLEGDWYAAGIFDYRLVTEVEFSEEKRRHEIIVQGNELDSATLSYWNGEVWGTETTLPESTANLFTIPGLFTTIRQSLINEIRDEVRAVFTEGPVYPTTIFLGVVRQEGVLVDGTEAKIQVSTLR